ncbi:MAG: S41 family peptidase [Acidobacteriota bacterium]|nr:S41 family peptidase [Acidobacteriota bacterium]
MPIKVKTTILVLSAAVVIFTVVGGMDGVRASSNNDGAYRQLQVYSEVLSRVRSEYVEEPNIPIVTSGALHGLLESLDANSSYLSPSEYKDYKAHKNDAKGEIGAAVSKRFGYASVISVIPGSPADKAGMQDTDIIEAIENKSTHEMSLAEIHNLLSGQPGSNVTISVVRARKAEPQKMVITRDMINVPPVSDKMVESGIGDIHVDAFTKGKSQEVAAKIKSLQKSGAKKLVLDLRNCAEGEKSEGVATANLFLNHGTITYVQGQKYPREAFNADPSKAITTLPLVVLVNKGTAGPAEIVAAAILENARGDVVGDKTFGEGSVQKLIDLPDGSALILSIAKYYSPSGKAIQDTAVTPNIIVADVDPDAAVPDENENALPSDEPKKTAPQQDEQMNKAVEILKNHAG